MPRKSKAVSLFEDDSKVEPTLAVNRSFAKSYESQKRKQDLAQARDAGLLDAVADSDDEESEDDGAALTTTMERKIQDAIAAIRRKDPKIYNKDAKFFEFVDVDESNHVAAAADVLVAEEPKRKTKKAADVIRDQLVAAAESGRSDAFDEDDSTTLNKRAIDDGDRRVGHRVYDTEQAALRSAFIQSVDQPAGDDTEFLRVKRGQQPNVDEDDGSSVVSADRERVVELMRKKDGQLAEHGADIVDPEAFLDAYVGSRAWLAGEEKEEDAEDTNARVLVPDDEDEEALDKADHFEAKYNFRFEEPGGGAIVSHSRSVEDTMRRKDAKRKEARDRKKERKAAELKEAEQETRRLMNLKRAELNEQTKKVQSIAGNGMDEARLAALLEKELDGEWDPAKYDSVMASLFSDEYYGEEELEGAGEASAEGSEPAGTKKGKIPSWVYGDGPRPAWAGPSGEELANGEEDGLGNVIDDEKGEEEEEEEEEEEHDAAVHGKRRKKDGKRKKAAKKRMSFMARVKTMLSADAQAARSGTASNRPDDPDDILALGFEDVIAGGLRTRFKYTAVPAQSYGLDDEEILLADDSDLNAYVSLKRIAPYRDSEWIVPSKKRKVDLIAMRAKLAETVESLGLHKPNVVGEEGNKAERSYLRDVEEAVAEDAEEDDAVEGDKKKRKRKRKHRTDDSGKGDNEDRKDRDAVRMKGAESSDAPRPKSSVSALAVTRQPSTHVHGQHLKADRERDGDKMVKVPSGSGTLKQSRLASYGL